MPRGVVLSLEAAEELRMTKRNAEPSRGVKERERTIATARGRATVE